MPTKPPLEHPDYPAAREAFLRSYPALHAGIFQPDGDARLLGYANYVLSLYAERRRDWQEGYDALAHMCFDFMKRQVRFNRTGAYGSTGRDELLGELYGDDERMDNYYLDAVLLSYAFWTNHVKMLAFYVEQFLPKLPERGTLFEIGCGPGLMPRVLLDTHPDWHYHAVDRSLASLRSARARLELGGVPTDRITLQQADGLDTDAALPVGVHTAGLCCEVLEHVHEPDRLLSRLFDALAPGAFAFVTTVANIEAEDHVYCFDDRQAMDDCVTNAGFRLHAVCALPLQGVPAHGRVALNYAAVAQKPANGG